MGLVRGRSLRWGLALLLVSSTAIADTSDAVRSAARNLASEGVRAFEEGNYVDAVDRFTRAEALIHAPPHLLYLARAFVRVGKLVQAKELYLKITREELAPSAPKAFVDAQKAAAGELTALEPRLAYLTIVVRGRPAETATVTLDGVSIPRALVDVASPTNPGKHVLRVAAAGWEGVEATVDLAEGSRETSTLTFTHESANTSDVEVRAGRSVAPWLAFGVAAVGVGVGTAFLFKNRGDRDDADTICSSGRCPPTRRGDVEALDASADRAATFAWIGYGVAGAAAVTGVALLFLQRPSSVPSPTGMAIVPWVGATSGGLAGRF